MVIARPIAHTNGQLAIPMIGEREAEGTRKSMAHTIRGLGYIGLGNTEKAKTDLTQAVELSVSNLWATTELKGM